MIVDTLIGTVTGVGCHGTECSVCLLTEISRRLILSSLTPPRLAQVFLSSSILFRSLCRPDSLTHSLVLITFRPSSWEKAGSNASSSLLGGWFLISFFTARILPFSPMAGTVRSVSKHLSYGEHYLPHYFVRKRTKNSALLMVSSSPSGPLVELVLFSPMTEASSSFQCFATSSVSFVPSSAGCSPPMKISGSIDRLHTPWLSGQ